MTSATFVAACAGSGEGLDENGRPTDEATAPLTAQLSSIQDKVLTPVCTTCHTGSVAPLGFRLDADVAYAMLVNAPSVEEPTLLRVAPGNPDASYLIQKLEGTATVGARMPLNGPPLSAETIAVIRQWISDGAPAATSPPTTLPTKLHSAWPAQDTILTEARAPIVLQSTQELDASLLDAGTVTLSHIAHEGAAPIQMTPRVVLRSLDPTVFAIGPDGGPTVGSSHGRWSPGRYELRLSGSAPLAIAARDSRPIDGDDDGEPGGDFVLRFEVEAER